MTRRKGRGAAFALDPRIANAALDLAMAFGPEWLQPTQARLAALHPELTKAALDEYDRVAQEAMRRGHALVLEVSRTLPPDAPGLRETWEKTMRARAPWISDVNLGRLFSQGLYYGRK